MKSERAIDLIICTYNNSALLDKTLTAIAEQKIISPINWGVLVVNNNSSDETPAIIEKHKSDFPVKLEAVFESEQGLHRARVCGIKNTFGDWMAFVDDDCLIAENFVEEIYRFAKNYPNCGLFGAKIELEWEIEPPLYAERRKWAFAGKNHGDSPQRRSWIAGTGMIIKRTALEESDWLDNHFLEDRVGSKLISGGDMEMGMRIARVCEVWYNPACLIRHQIPARRLTREYVRKITFGLGASRHNVAALSWKKSYLSWLFYSLAYSLGLTIYAIFEAIREFISSPKKADIPTAFAPVKGWYAATWQMLRMDKEKRRVMLGSVAD